MTAVEERRLLAQYLETCVKLHVGFARAVERVGALLPITPARLDTLPIDEEETMLSFLKRYEQFEDALHRGLKTVALIMAIGRDMRLEPRDVANKAEKFGIVDADLWAEAVRARNALAHEYPLRPDKRAEQVNGAWQQVATLERTWANIRRFVDQEGLLNDPR